jgi:hypothetical protein
LLLKQNVEEREKEGEVSIVFMDPRRKIQKRCSIKLPRFLNLPEIINLDKAF